MSPFLISSAISSERRKPHSSADKTPLRPSTNGINKIRNSWTIDLHQNIRGDKPHSIFHLSKLQKRQQLSNESSLPLLPRSPLKGRPRYFGNILSLSVGGVCGATFPTLDLDTDQSKTSSLSTHTQTHPGAT